jgi:hypothetical protein
MSVLRCPNCGAHHDEDHEFSVTEVGVKATRVGFITSSFPEIEVEALDTQYEGSGRYELSCGTCGHQWPTKREIPGHWNA